jgi:hypothetical protein
MRTPEKLAAAESTRVQVALPPNRAAQAPNSDLTVGSHQQPQGPLDGGSFRAFPACSHSLAHQALVDVDVRTHVDV